MTIQRTEKQLRDTQLTLGNDDDNLNVGGYDLSVSAASNGGIDLLVNNLYTAVSVSNVNLGNGNNTANFFAMGVDFDGKHTVTINSSTLSGGGIVN